MSEKDKFYEERDKKILPSDHWGWRDTKEFLTLPAYSLLDYLYLKQIKECYLNMQNPSSDENMNKMTDFLIKAVMENKKMSVDFLETVGGYPLFEIAQRKVDRIYPEMSDEFHEKTQEVWDDVCDIRYQRDAKYCQAYFKKKPKEIAMFSEGEMYRILRKLPRRQSKKLLFLYLKNHGRYLKNQGR